MTLPAALVRLATVLLLAAAFPARALPSDAPLASEEPAPEGQEAAPPRRHFWRALGEVTAVNLAVWSVDWFIRKADWAEVSPEVWRRNLTGGFEWDADKFSANQLDHPYHGGIYYNIARDNGFSYWDSSVFTFLGSLQWELFAENNPPSINDTINSGIGGLAIGEVLWRLSSMTLDNRATGRERVGREVLSGLISPGRGFSRVVRGEAWRVGPTPRDWQPPVFGGFGRAGYLQEGAGVDGEDGTGQLMLGFGLRYGDPFLDGAREPFDSFTVDATFISRQGRFISHAEVRGLLAATSLVQRPRWQLLLGAYQLYDYLDVRAYEVGSQAFSGSLLFRHELRGDVDLRAALHLRGLALAAISSDFEENNERTYDYGPGLGLTFRAGFGAWPWEYASLELATSWIHTLDGTEYNHLVHEGRLQVDIPLFSGLGLGGSLQLYRRDTLIPHAAADTLQLPRFQVFLSLH